MIIQTRPGQPELHVTRNGGGSFSVVSQTPMGERARLRLNRDECLALAAGLLDVVARADEQKAAT